MNIRRYILQAKIAVAMAGKRQGFQNTKWPAVLYSQ